VLAPSLTSIVVAPSVVVGGNVAGTTAGLAFVTVLVVVDPATVTTVLSRGSAAMVALPPKIAICVEEPGMFSKQIGELGTTVNGCNGVPVPTVVVTPKLVL